MTDLALVIGIMIIAGLFGGLLAHRFKFPMITGYIVVGILLSPDVFNIIPEATVDRLEVFTSIALGIIAYTIGSNLCFESIRKMERSIIWIIPFESLGAWIITTLILSLAAPFILNIPDATFWSTYFPIALVIGAIASATAPAVVIAIVREYKAKGPFTTTLLSTVGLDDAISVIAFTISIGIEGFLTSASHDLSLSEFLLPALKIIESIILGIILSFSLIYMIKLVKKRATTLSMVLGTTILCVGISRLLGISEILSNMIIGLVIANKAKRHEMLQVIDDIEDVVFAMFFVLAGMHFNINAMKSAGIVALLIVFSRFAGKYLGARSGSRLAQSSDVLKKYLGLALLPQAGVAIGLALLAQNAFPTFGAFIFNAVLAGIIINELISPPIVRFAIFKSGEQMRESEEQTA